MITYKTAVNPIATDIILSKAKNYIDVTITVAPLEGDEHHTILLINYKTIDDFASIMRMIGREVATKLL